MPNPVSVLLVHGIGISQPDWARRIIFRLQEAVLEEVRRLLCEQAPPDLAADDVLAVEAAYWGGILQARENDLYLRLDRGHEALQGVSGWMQLLWRWLRKKEYRFVADAIGDILGYLDGEIRLKVQQTLTEALLRLRRQTANLSGELPLTIIAHSLGCVVSSEYVWDATRVRLQQGQTGFDPVWEFANFFTLGSPLALFSLKFGGPEAFKKPVTVEAGAGRWINLFDDDDPIGMPLRLLNEAYEKAVFRDVLVESGLYLLAHDGYFLRSAAPQIIGRKLAVDWASANGYLSGLPLKEAYAAYDAWVGTFVSH